MKNTKNTSYGDSSPFNNLVVLEMANNHMGDYNHGIKMIHEFAEIVKPYKKQFNFAWKFQFRDIDTFIHPSFQERTDIKYVKRFNKHSFVLKPAELRSQDFKDIDLSLIQEEQDKTKGTLFSKCPLEP